MTEETNRDYHPMWEKPKHHTEAKFKTNEVHWIELFYDLIHVVCIFLLGNALSHNLNVE
jgi:low temperature requirement protein LtrA